ncbi:MAG: SRPBCC family protein [Pyrinomonadaceae bacterium]|nr:SRPBCC family protein [Pyrinomonadaceae bacterium]
MPVIKLNTEIDAPIERVFDLSRSIDLHTRTASQTNERAVAGRTEGLIELGESVTWTAVHFGFRLSHTSLITEYDRPVHFKDSMTQGMFSRFDHDHEFEEMDGVTRMMDRIDFESPFGILGNIFDTLFLTRYLEGFLNRRNSMIKEFAESHKWKRFLE